METHPSEQFFFENQSPLLTFDSAFLSENTSKTCTVTVKYYDHAQFGDLQLKAPMKFSAYRKVSTRQVEATARKSVAHLLVSSSDFDSAHCKCQWRIFEQGILEGKRSSSWPSVHGSQSHFSYEVYQDELLLYNQHEQLKQKRDSVAKKQQEYEDELKNQLQFVFPSVAQDYAPIPKVEQARVYFPQPIYSFEQTSMQQTTIQYDKKKPQKKAMTVDLGSRAQPKQLTTAFTANTCANNTFVQDRRIRRRDESNRNVSASGNMQKSSLVYKHSTRRMVQQRHQPVTTTSTNRASKTISKRKK